MTPDTDQDEGKKTYEFDPHLDPQLQWAGKTEHTSFEVPTTSLHVHERIDPRTVIEAVEKRNGKDDDQPALFESKEENPPLRQAIDFYQHEHSWSNRMIAGDSLVVMNSLLEKEGMAGQVQTIYMDPPYGIKYGSNFQPFVNNRDVKDGKDEDLTAEPEMIRAFRDTWELGIHSYLTHLRDRLLLARELLTESGSVFVQISDENIHHVRELMDEVFGAENFVGLICFQTKIPLRNSYLPGVCDYILWYGKDYQNGNLKYHSLFVPQSLSDSPQFSLVQMPNGEIRTLTDEERAEPKLLPTGAKAFTSLDLASSGRTESCVFDFEWNGKKYSPTSGKSWKTNREGMEVLAQLDRLYATKTALRYKLFIDDYPVKGLTNVWTDTVGVSGKIYAVQTAPEVIRRCLLMSTDPGDLVVDPTCGSGTTAFVAEQWGRRWITCDTSRVAITLAKQRLMTSLFDYYKLAHPEEGVGSGFKYKTVPHITLGSITNNPEIEPSMSRERLDAAIARHAPQETLYDQPVVDNKKARVTGPFTVEAVPAPTVQPLSDIQEEKPADESVARSGPTLRQEEWRDELLSAGIRGKGGQHIAFTRVEPLGGTRYLHAEAETSGDAPERVVLSFGPEHAPLEQRQVELAWEEARTLSPKPAIIVFAAFQFDSEAAKDIDELTKDKTGMTFLKAQMSADLLTEDLKKKRASNESFWLIGQPDVDLRPATNDGSDGGSKNGSSEYEVEVNGFDYYNTKTGGIESGDTGKIAMWMLDTDYDGRSLYPRQVFFPMSGQKDGWSRLAKNLGAQIDEDLIESYRGTVSLPFEAGEHGRVAVKIVDDRGIESLKIMEVS